MRTTRLGWGGAMLFCLSVTMSAQPSDVVRDPKAADFGTSSLTHVRITAMEFVPLQSGLAGEWKSAGGFTIAMQAAWMALKRVAHRFFGKYDPARI